MYISEGAGTSTRSAGGMECTTIGPGRQENASRRGRRGVNAALLDTEIREEAFTGSSIHGDLGGGNTLVCSSSDYWRGVSF